MSESPVSTSAMMGQLHPHPAGPSSEGMHRVLASLVSPLTVALGRKVKSGRMKGSSQAQQNPSVFPTAVNGSAVPD